MSGMLTRRAVMTGLAGTLVAGCDRLGESEGFRSILYGAERLNLRAQRLLVDRTALAPEFTSADLSPVFRPNGTRLPGTSDYARHMAEGFAGWRLTIDGLVARPLNFRMDQLLRLPRRTQITRHDCVEGWSAIGQWTGVPLRLLLDAAGMRDSARFLVFHCADRYGSIPYYETIDLVDALHPQTIIAYGLNGSRLPVANGAPLRLRVERQLGYKHAKYVHRIEAVASLDGIGLGKGGFWEDRADYEWFAGI